MEMMEHTENSSISNQEKESSLQFQIDVDREEAKADATNVAESILDIVGNKPKKARKNSPNSVEVYVKPKKAHKKQVLLEGVAQMDSSEVQSETTEINSDMQMVEDTDNSSSSSQEKVKTETSEINFDMEIVEDTGNSSSFNQEKVRTGTTEINSDMQMVKGTENLSRSNQDESRLQFQMEVNGEDANTHASDTAKLVVDIAGGGNHGPNSAKVHNKPKKAHINQVVPEDYICTSEDILIIEQMISSPENKILVDINDAYVDRYHMDCLFHNDAYLNGDVISAYIHCIRGEKHLLYREGGKVFLENSYISSILKRDGTIELEQINYNDDTIETRVDNYLDHDMVFLPINIELFHWYLAVVNAKKCEIHVLDSMRITDRKDLNNTLKGLGRQIALAAQYKKLNQDKWKNLNVETWPVIEKFGKPMQTDGSSCGLWMLNYMEYWTGSYLSDTITQKDITEFRYKLAAILMESKLNKRRGYREPKQINEAEESPDDCEIIEAPHEVPIFSETPHEMQKSSDTSHQNEPDTYLYVISLGETPTTKEELLGALCTYIISIDHPESLEKEWIQSTKPYPISLSLKKLQGILNVKKPMDSDCFNLAVRKIACNDLLKWLEDTKHYMDLQFYSTYTFAQDPRGRPKLDVQRLAKLLECWPDMEYNISYCTNILLPYSFLGHFVLLIFDMKARSVSILDPRPIPEWLNCHPSMCYIQDIHYISNSLNLALEEANPMWHDDVYCWRREFPTWVPKTKDRNATGYFVIDFMCSWDGIRLTSDCTDEGMLRAMFLIDLLKYTDNECSNNIPEDIREFLKRSRI